jgi:hypothetical protein
MKRLKVIDLFSGLGGASAAFVDRNHSVIRYDIDERFAEVPFTIIRDVRELIGELNLTDIDIVLAGFPCNDFSVLANHLTWPRGIPREHTRQMIGFVRELREWLEQSPCKYYIVENPVGMMRNRQALGKPAATITWAAYRDQKGPKKPTDLWGRLPPFVRKLPFQWEKAPRGANAGIQKTGFRAEERSLWPYGFSLAVCLAVEGKSPQATLENNEYT